MDYPTVDQIEINAENKDSFGQMQNHVCLVAQLQLAGSTSGGVKEVLDKSAKYYYGFRDENNTINTMYNKNPDLVKNEIPLNARLNTGNSSKSLTPIIPLDENEKIKSIKKIIKETFEGYKVVPTPGDSRDTFKKEAYKGLDETFDGLLISDRQFLGQGARIMLYAKYTKNDDKVNAYGQMLFIKSGSVESLKLKIKDNVVTLGSMVGAKKKILSLMNDLFGVTFSIAPKSAAEVEAGSGAGSGAGAGAEAGADGAVNRRLMIENGPLVPEAPVGNQPLAIENGTINDIDMGGGKSASRRRRMSSKKGGRNNSASRKQNKKGGAKARRSQKAGKRMR